MVENTKVSPKTNFPEKPITMIVPFSVGGGMDLTARAMEKVSLQYLDKPLVIVNKPGAAGIIGWNEVASTALNGYTIGIAGVDIELQSAYGSGKYNYVTSLEPVAQITEYPFILVTTASQPWDNVDELISYAKQHPDQIKYGHWGVGSIGHVVGKMFADNAGIQMGYVPFQGGNEIVGAMLGEHIQLMFISPITVKEYVKQGRLKALAITGEQRLSDPEFANVPTLKELGIDLISDTWQMVCVPKDLPSDIKMKLAEGCKGIITDPEFQIQMQNMGMPVKYFGPNEAMKIWLDDWEKYSKAVKETGILDEIKSQKR